MFARVTLNLGGRRQGLLLPREAVVYRGEQSGVFLLEESRARFRPIEIGYSLQDSVEIRSGIALGEKVISMGASLLKDGDQVRLRGEGPARGGSGEGAPPSEAPRKKRG
jgi:multidrug efflux pump subunit AcrA (membrane-fusion protein)